MINSFSHNNTVIDVLSHVWDGAIIEMLGEMLLIVAFRSDVVIGVFASVMFDVDINVVAVSASLVSVSRSTNILTGVVISAFPSVKFDVIIDIVPGISVNVLGEVNVNGLPVVITAL